jgi:hypothetical protein
MIFINKNSFKLKKFQYPQKKTLCKYPNVKEIYYTSFSQSSFNFLFLQI